MDPGGRTSPCEIVMGLHNSFSATKMNFKEIDFLPLDKDIFNRGDCWWLFNRCEGQ